MSSSEQFKGEIGRTVKESTPWWPGPKRSEDGSPNVVVILLDDTGFGHFGCYGSTIETPNFDRLAGGGLRYNNFHTTALCSPTRASLLTGRNHHTVGMRALANFDTGYPNMRGCISPHAATIAEILREEGYATFAAGKWHLAPMEEASTAGPFDNWPLQRGFDRFYGFLQGETDQFHPELTYDNHPVEPPCGPDEGYHLSEDIVDQSMAFIRDSTSIRPDRPFFLYLAFGATHSPHQAPREFIEKYRGRFDEGWDVVREKWYRRQIEMGVIPEDTELAPRNPGVRPWDELSENEKKFALRLQEAFAAMLDHTDQQVGRLIDFLEDMEQIDNTLIVLLSDNGASQEGGPTGVMDEFKYFNGVPEDVDTIQDRLDDIGGPHSHSNIPWGWAQAGNSPLKWYKQNTHGGGVRDPLIMHWPARIKDHGGVRGQFHHVSDIVPTILEMLDIDAPDTYRGYDQMPMTGTSMAYSFDGANEPTRKQVQYFEMFGHRGIWADGWKAVTYHRPGTPFNDDEWELYHLTEDFSESRNLAAEHPEKLREMIDLWWVEAGRQGVLPLDDRRFLFKSMRRKGTPHASRHYTYYPPLSHVPSDVAPTLGSRTWTVSAEVDRPDASIQGVIAAQGTQNGGYSWYIKDNKMVFDYNIFAEHHVVRSDTEVPIGRIRLEIRFVRHGETGKINLVMDGQECGTIQVPYVMRMISSTGLDIGKDSLSPVTDDYAAPFAFKGKIRRFDVVLHRYRSPKEKQEDEDVRMRTEMAKQ